MTGWSRRIKRQVSDEGPTVKRRATWAAAALALVSVIAQVVNVIRVDLKPVSSKLDEINTKVGRIEQKLEDHERRIKEVEKKVGLDKVDTAR